jgi:hypothetical protein
VRNFPGENCSPAPVNSMSRKALESSLVSKNIHRPTIVKKVTPPPREYCKTVMVGEERKMSKALTSQPSSIRTDVVIEWSSGLKWGLIDLQEN